jgi:hypothetical protein
MGRKVNFGDTVAIRRETGPAPGGDTGNHGAGYAARNGAWCD